MSASFAVTWDYRCPFARNAHEHVITALQDGADWDVTFLPLALGQFHVEEGQPPVWEDPNKAKDLQVTLAAIVTRDRYPEHFLALHEKFFTARHGDNRDLRETEVVVDLLNEAGVPADKVLAEIEDGWPLELFRSTHESLVNDHSVFGVPTFIIGERAVFVRLMNRPKGDAARARSIIEQVLQLIDTRPEINEFKYTTLSR
jgi:hypothetical protein